MGSPARSRVTMSPNFIGRRHTYGGHNMTARIALAAAKSGRPIRHSDADLALLQSSWRPRSCFFPIVRWPTKAASVSGSPGSLEALRPRPSSRVGRWRRSATTPPYRPAPMSHVRAKSRSVGFRPPNSQANLNLSVNATGSLGLVIPTYVFATPVLGGQASVALLGSYGVVDTSLAGTLSGVVTTPFGSVPFARPDAISDKTWGFGDLIPLFHCAGTPASTTT